MAPFTLFKDSSWQDCPDTGRSTGSYVLFHQDGIVDCATFLPTPVAMSSAEAEYNALAQSIQGVISHQQLVHELHSNHPDTLLSIPV